MSRRQAATVAKLQQILAMPGVRWSAWESAAIQLEQIRWHSRQAQR